MAQAVRRTDIGGMELLELEPSLALLADCAAEARRGDGRLVVLGGRLVSARGGGGGYPLGRRGDHGAAPVRRPTAPRHTGPAGRHLPRRRPGHGRSAAGRAGRASQAPNDPADRPGTAVRRRGPGAGRWQQPGGRRAVPADRRKPVLRDRGPAGRDGGGTGLGTGRRAGPTWAARTRPRWSGWT